MSKLQAAELAEIATLIGNANATAESRGMPRVSKIEERSITSDYWKRKAEDEEQRLYDLAADIAHEVAEDLPDRVKAAGADPLNAAFALWNTFTSILLQNGWSACELAEAAHELMEEIVEEKPEEDASRTIQ